MKRNYQAAFIIPFGASKVLGEDGWDFYSVERLPESMEEYLAGRLNLEFVEEYSGIRRYTGSQINMSIFSTALMKQRVFISKLLIMVWLCFLKPAKVKRSLVMQKSSCLKSKSLQKELLNLLG